MLKAGNPDFKPLECEGFRREAGLNAFTLSPKKWIETTNAIGLISKSGRYGGTLKCLRSNKPVRLERWLDKYEKSILPRISTFVRGISMDIKAVKNAMIYHVSNGITEGFVNKLKTTKRVMYGKAKLPLLKIKMVMPTWIFN